MDDDDETIATSMLMLFRKYNTVDYVIYCRVERKDARYGLFHTSTQIYGFLVYMRGSDTSSN